MAHERDTLVEFLGRLETHENGLHPVASKMVREFGLKERFKHRMPDLTSCVSSPGEGGYDFPKEMGMNFDNLLSDITTLDQVARTTAGRSVDRLLTLRNWLIGACIVEYEQNGEDRAAYGQKLLSKLAKSLKDSGHKGLQLRNLKNCRQIALTYPRLEIRQTLSAVFGTVFTIRKDSGDLQALPTPFRSAFPTLAERARNAESLEWQDQTWYERLFSTCPSHTYWSCLGSMSRSSEPSTSWNA